MRVLLTNKRSIKSKSGITYVKIDFIKPSDGSTGNIFTSTEDWEKMGGEKLSLVRVEDLSAALDKFATVDASFDQQGRIEAVS